MESARANAAAVLRRQGKRRQPLAAPPAMCYRHATVDSYSHHGESTGMPRSVPLRLCVVLILLAGHWIAGPAMHGKEPLVVQLWPGVPPGDEQLALPAETDRTTPDDKLIAGRRVMRITNVSTPQLSVYQPDPERANGAAVIICPGGGHSVLAYDLEGTEIAAWLNALGATGVVLKYRVPFRDPDRRYQAAVQDAQRAVSLVRSRADEWHIDPAKIGIMGFSAGGETAALAALQCESRTYARVDAVDDVGCRPDAALLIYPGGLVDKGQDKLRDYIQTPTTAPPFFLVHAGDDRVSAGNSLLLAAALKDRRIPVELHLFPTGGHGYGLRFTSEPVTTWPTLAERWLRQQGWLTPTDRAPQGSPADHLPPHIRQLTDYGERADFSPDGRHLLFLSKQFGDVMELEIATGKVRCLSQHFLHHGFNRALYLANGDLLLTGPSRPFDATDRAARKLARHTAMMFVLERDGQSPPVPLGYECDEGPAVSRTRLAIAFAHGDQDRISLGTLQYVDGRPQLTEVRAVLALADFPATSRPTMLEPQNFVPQREDQLTVTAYRLQGGHNTDTFRLNTRTRELTNITDSPELYEECEGIFPDGQSTVVERNDCQRTAWPMVDAWQVWFDGQREPRRLTRFLDYPGYKASNYVVSDDGRWMAFQLGKAGDEAGVGYGLFLYDLEKGGR